MRCEEYRLKRTEFTETEVREAEKRKVHLATRAVQAREAEVALARSIERARNEEEASDARRAHFDASSELAKANVLMAQNERVLAQAFCALECEDASRVPLACEEILECEEDASWF